MAAFRPRGSKNNVISDRIYYGDLMVLGEALAGGVVAADVGTVLTAAAIVTGIITRTGAPGAGITDTTDSAVNIMTALAGNAPAADLAVGDTFRMLLCNRTGQAITLAAGAGVVLDTTLGSGVVNCAASVTREYLVTVNSVCPSYNLQATVTNASKTVSFVLQPGQVAIGIGYPNGLHIEEGATISGANITTGTTVAGLIMGVGGITGVTMSANATGTATESVAIGPTLTITGLGTRGN